MTKQGETQIIQTEEDIYECRVDSSLIPGITRMLTGTTHQDSKIDSLDIPQQPIWLNVIVRAIKWYRNRVSQKLGHRCVYEPSCSRYSELSFRKYGLVRGLILTIKRLLRCRPGYGGIDLP